MSKSSRKTPIFGNTTAETEKYDKRLANRRLRRIVRAVLENDKNIEILPTLREVSNVWLFNKDGKRWQGDWVKTHPEIMRK